MVPGSFETAAFDLESSKLGSSGHISYDSLGGTIRVVNEDRSDGGSGISDGIVHGNGENVITFMIQTDNSIAPSCP